MKLYFYGTLFGCQRHGFFLFSPLIPKKLPYQLQMFYKQLSISYLPVAKSSYSYFGSNHKAQQIPAKMPFRHDAQY